MGAGTFSGPATAGWGLGWCTSVGSVTAEWPVRCGSSIRSRTMSIRFAPTVAPTIVVRSAGSPSNAWNPSHAPRRAPPIAAVNPMVLVVADRLRFTQAR